MVCCRCLAVLSRAALSLCALEASEAETIIASLGQDGAAHLLPAEYAISGLLSLQIPAAAFADADANVDAVLTRVEARGASYALIHLAGDPVFLSTSDTDGSGGLSEGEFLSAMPAGAFAETDVDRVAQVGERLRHDLRACESVRERV